MNPNIDVGSKGWWGLYGWVERCAHFEGRNGSSVGCGKLNVEKGGIICGLGPGVVGKSFPCTKTAGGALDGFFGMWVVWAFGRGGRGWGLFPWSSEGSSGGFTFGFGDGAVRVEVPACE